MNISIKGLQNKEYSEQKKRDMEWSANIKERDEWNCQICGSIFFPSAHHIIPRENKQYRYDLDNGITLCRNHHKFSRKISAHNNPMAFFLWLQKYKYVQFCTAIERTKEIVRGICEL